MNSRRAVGHARTRTVKISLSFRILLFLCFLVASRNCSGANVLLIQESSGQSTTQQQLEAASTFYGLTFENVTVKVGNNDAIVLRSLRSTDLLAVVINADALPALDEKNVLSSLSRGGRQIPLIVAGINGHTDFTALKQWSRGIITGSGISDVKREDGRYTITAGNDVTLELGGTQLPLLTDDIPFLTMNSGVNSEKLVEARHGAAEFPILVRATIPGRKIFFAAENPAVDIPAIPDPYRQQAVFTSLISFMLFLHYAAGEHAWHSPEEYANFTIDDLWLREPYGHVNYEDLLQHSQIHNFHTTIAFIPWNFDRSQPRMVTLFREHADRLSICIHGNDHVHQEFGPLDSHPLREQIENMRQGLARMEQFHALTQVPYDAVMVFPHSVAPTATFAELRRNGYLATANSLNVPSDAAVPKSMDFALRTATLHFGDFPSMRRYSAESNIPRAQLAIDAFLGNPMLFYAHESFFSGGIHAFDQTADLVNTFRPGTQWRSLGFIARHLYLEKMNDDNNFEIRAYSSTVQISNTHDHDADFLITKEEDFSQPVRVLIDGKSSSFEQSGSQLRLRLRILKGRTREISIFYGNNIDLASVDVAKHSLRTNAIRGLSDFRDNTVSNTEIGRRFIRSYAENGRTWNLVMTAMALLFLACILIVVNRVRRRKSQLARMEIVPASQPG